MLDGCAHRRIALMILAVCTIVTAGAGCGSAENTLSDAEMDKLAPALQRVVQGDPSATPQRLPTETRPDGTTAYVVLVRMSDADAVRKAGIPINSVQGSVATARLSVGELRKAARLDAVTRIEPSGESFPTK